MSALAMVSTLLGVCVAMYIIYWMFSGSHTLSKLESGTSSTRIPESKLKANNSNNYAYSIWFYMKDWGYRFGEKKTLFVRKEGSNVCPSVSFDSSNNNIVIETSMYPFGASDTDSGLSPLHTTTVTNFPLQRWVNLIVSVYGRTMDIYMDGKLVRSVVLPALTRTCHNAPVVITPDGGFQGWTSGFRYWADALNPQEAYNVYRNGYGGSLFGSMFNKYRLKLSFLDGSEEKGSLEI